MPWHMAQVHPWKMGQGSPVLTCTMPQRTTKQVSCAPLLSRLQPQDMPGYPRNEWWNMFVLHQNRVLHGPQVGHWGTDVCVPA
jgi:hypothetical protein